MQHPPVSIGVGFALLAGAADILGVATYSIGAERGDVSILLASSAVFPLIAVVASFVWLHERGTPQPLPKGRELLALPFRRIAETAGCLVEIVSPG